MKKNEKIEKAYKNLDFLNSADARTIRILSEYYEPYSRLKKNNIKDTIVFFGSARLLCKEDALKNLKNVTKEEKNKTKPSQKKIDMANNYLDLSKYYEDAVELSKRLTTWSLNRPEGARKFTICSGGGPGIMEAANKGAMLAGGDSIGFNISLPFEQFVNKYIKPENAYEFHYFFMRKLWFVYLAKGLAVFPGGFGTLDEFSEILTLVQTKKVTKNIKIIAYDEKYWKDVINFDNLIKYGVISAEDMKLFDFCNTVDEAYEKLTKHYESLYKK